MSKKYKKKKSNIEGVGVFASNNLKNNTIIKFKMEIEANYKSKYLFPWFGNAAYNNIASYFNHSNKPNLKIIDRNRKKEMLIFQVIKEIKENQEMTFDYQTDESKYW